MAVLTMCTAPLLFAMSRSVVCEVGDMCVSRCKFATLSFCALVRCIACCNVVAGGMVVTVTHRCRL
eukprot:12236525-Prorocentrum_lima.AAC.1